MLLTAASAKALATVVLFGTLGSVEGRKRLPLAAALSGPNWIVRGRTDPIARPNILTRGFHVYIDRSTAEIRGLATMDANIRIPPDVMKVLRQDGWRPPRLQVLGLPPDPGSPTPPDLALFLYNGVLGTPKAAIAYARELLRTAPGTAAPSGDLLAVELRDHVWHVTRHASGGASYEVMSLSQINGKVLSGNL